MRKTLAKNALLIGIQALLAAPLTGCFETTSSDNVKAKAVYQRYSVSYSAADSTLSSYAEFDVGGPLGTSLSLKSPSHVTFDGMELKEENFLGTHYVQSWSQGFSSAAHSWKWIDQDGKAYANSIAIVPFTVAWVPANWSISGSLIVQISGPAPTSEELFSASVSQNTSNGSVSASTDVTVLDSTHLSIQIRQYQGIPSVTPGTATLSLSRSRSSALQQSTETGGDLSARYTAMPILVQLVQ